MEIKIILLNDSIIESKSFSFSLFFLNVIPILAFLKSLKSLGVISVINSLLFLNIKNFNSLPLLSLTMSIICLAPSILILFILKILSLFFNPAILAGEFRNTFPTIGSIRGLIPK